MEKTRLNAVLIAEQSRGHANFLSLCQLLLTLCVLACPCPTSPPLTLCPAPKDSLYSSRAPHSWQWLLHPSSPTASSPVLCSSTTFTALCVRSLQDGAACSLQGKRQELLLAAICTSHWHGVPPKQGHGVSGVILICTCASEVKI